MDLVKELERARTDLAETKEALDLVRVRMEVRKHFSEILDVYREDIDLYTEYSRKDPRPVWGRTLVRAMFAGIEGLSYCQKQVALAEAGVRNTILTNAELAMVREEAYGLNDKGKVETKNSKLGTAANVLFSLRVFARARGEEYELDKSSKGWQAFKSSLEVRNRITHPKRASDLDVTDDEVSTMLAASSWFIAENARLMKASETPETQHQTELTEMAEIQAALKGLAQAGPAGAKFKDRIEALKSPEQRHVAAAVARQGQAGPSQPDEVRRLLRAIAANPPRTRATVATAEEKFRRAVKFRNQLARTIADRALRPPE